ncbi:MAG: thiamine phosphate synthase [Lachnospiraceae bacterium]|nr:thiamine phosphate synthase [Lachnospiraceae bacterium]
MSMYNQGDSLQGSRICITNRVLLTGKHAFDQDVLHQILDRIALIGERGLADALILREKDLSSEDYLTLAESAQKVCQKVHLPLILHHFPEAEEVFPDPLPLHLSMPDFLSLCEGPPLLHRLGKLPVIGVSTHTVSEALEAERLGAAYITASHIFPTDCKKDLAPRGLDYLREVCHSVQIPVFALGGIHPHNVQLCLENGAAGVCMMSEYFSVCEPKAV